MSKPTEIMHVHGDSMRVGIRLASIVYTNAMPPEDVVKRIADTRPTHLIVNEFPMASIKEAVREKQERRRIYAKSAMEVLLHKSGDALLMTRDDLEKVANQAWALAGFMEEQEHVSASLDSIERK
jgi:hypothetical protein